MQNKTSRLHATVYSVGPKLKINTRKTKVISISDKSTKPHITLKREIIVEVEDFTYLGGTSMANK